MSNKVNVRILLGNSVAILVATLPPNECPIKCILAKFSYYSKFIIS